MRLSLLADRVPLSVPTRWLLFGIAVILGALGGNTINIEPLGWAYDSLLNAFAEPGIQIASLTAGLGLGFLLGLIHLTSI